MSCYLTDAETIGMIARWAADNCTSAFNPSTKEFTKMEGNPSSIATTLGWQNVFSCEARYPDHGPAGGFLNDEISDSAYVRSCRNASRRKGDNISPAAVWRMVASLEYQSCETEDWFETDAYWICHAIKEAAGRKMAEDLVSVEARQWT